MYGATIPEDAEAILSKQAKNQAPGALDEEAGGDSQPAQKSYGRIVHAGLALLAFVLIAGAAVAGINSSNYTVGESGAFALSSEGQCPPGSEEALRCNTTYELCRTKASKIPNGMLQQKFINICMNGARKKTLPPCCVN